MNGQERQQAMESGQQLAYSAYEANAKTFQDVSDEELAAYVNDTHSAIDEAETPAAVITAAHHHYRYVYEQLRRQGSL